MLTIPIDRIAALLAQASEIEIGEDEDVPESGARAPADPEQAVNVEDVIVDMAAYRELMDALEEFTPEELHELLAVAALGASDETDPSWDAAVEQARSIAEDEAVSEIARILVLTDAIETGLDRLGYSLDDEDEEEEEEEEDEDEDEDEDEEEDED